MPCIKPGMIRRPQDFVDGLAGSHHATTSFRHDVRSIRAFSTHHASLAHEREGDSPALILGCRAQGRLACTSDRVECGRIGTLSPKLHFHYSHGVTLFGHFLKISGQPNAYIETAQPAKCHGWTIASLVLYHGHATLRQTSI